MIVGLGMDVAELGRIKGIYSRYGQRFVDRLLTDAERGLMPKMAAPFLASRFAAKEAAVKALGTGFRHGIGLHDIEIASGPMGEPLVRFFGKALERALALEVVRAHVSLSHGRDVAAAVVVLEAP